MKKIFIIILSLILCFSVISCKKAKDVQSSDSESNTQSTKVSDIGDKGTTPSDSELHDGGPNDPGPPWGVLFAEQELKLDTLKALLELSKGDGAKYKEYVQDLRTQSIEEHDFFPSLAPQHVMKEICSVVERYGLPLIKSDATDYVLTAYYYESKRELNIGYTVGEQYYGFVCGYERANEYEEPEGTLVFENVNLGEHSFDLYQNGDTLYGRFISENTLFTVKIRGKKLNCVSFDNFYIGSLTDIE